MQSKTRGRVVSRIVIRSLALAGAASAVVIAPNMAQLIGKNLKHLDKMDARRTLYYLKYRKLIEVRTIDGHEEYRLTESGLRRYKQIKLDELVIKTPRKWDTKWRMVIFDIPRYKQSQRDQFLAHLKKLNFYMLQRSVWIHPFECSEQIGILLYELDLEKEVSYLVVENGNFVMHAEYYFKKTGLLI